MEYDSTQDTLDHIHKVRDNLTVIINNLDDRSISHDISKLHDPEKAIFDIATPKLKGLVYGSEEYRNALKEIEPALKHHYAVNDHHPEWSSEGIRGMSLMSILEMLADWRAAGQRHDPPTPFQKSIDINVQRFSISQDLTAIIQNTAKELGWL